MPGTIDVDEDGMIAPQWVFVRVPQPSVSMYVVKDNLAEIAHYKVSARLTHENARSVYLLV